MSLVSWVEKRLGVQSEQEQLKFLPQSVKLEEAVNPHIIRLTMIVISCAIFVFLFWAAFTPIKEIARAEGEVTPRGYTQVVQHLHGGIVTEILIDEGDTVKTGQTLIRIDDGQAKQDLAEAHAKLSSLLLQQERLSAYLESRTPNFKPLLKGDVEASSTQQAMFDSYLQALNKDKEVLEQQLQQKRDEVTRLKQRKKSLTKSLALSSQAQNLQEEMHGKGYASKLTVIKYRQESHQLQGELNEVKEEIQKSQSAQAEYLERLKSLAANQRDNAYQDIDTINANIDQTQESVTKLRDRAERLDITAPVDGIVKGLQVNTIGGIIGPGSTLMEIVPLNSQLVVDARISPKDIGHIKVGQPIRVKVSSFDFSRYGTINGSLDFVSATTFLNEANQPYYRARIGLDQQYLGVNPNTNLILPGMTVIGDIITGEKTLLEYLLKPIHLSMKTAFSER